MISIYNNSYGDRLAAKYHNHYLTDIKKLHPNQQVTLIIDYCTTFHIFNKSSIDRKKMCSFLNPWENAHDFFMENNAAAYTTKNFFKAQNPRLINESGFKSRAAYDGARTVYKCGHCTLTYSNKITLV